VCHKSRVIDVSKCVTIMCGWGVIVVRYQYYYYFSIDGASVSQRPLETGYCGTMMHCVVM